MKRPDPEPKLAKPIMDVGCPKCMAQPGRFCAGMRWSKSGERRIIGKYHQERIALAMIPDHPLYLEFKSALRRQDHIWRMDHEIHPSHRMGIWTSDVVNLVGTPRFGQVRACKDCEGEQAETVAGHQTDPQLREPCYERCHYSLNVCLHPGARTERILFMADDDTAAQTRFTESTVELCHNGKPVGRYRLVPIAEPESGTLNRAEFNHWLKQQIERTESAECAPPQYDHDGANAYANGACKALSDVLIQFARTRLD